MPKKTSTLHLAQKNTSSMIVEDNFDGPSIQVEMTNLAGIIKKEDLPHPDVVKIDVEGFELSVLTGIDFKNKNLLLVEIEVTLKAHTLSGVVATLSENGFSLAKVRTHGDQAYNPRNWFRGKIQGLMRKLGLANYAVVKSEESWSKPSTLLTQIELIFVRDVDPSSDDYIQSAICEIYGLASRQSPGKKLQCGQKNVKLLNDITLIR